MDRRTIGATTAAKRITHESRPDFVQSELFVQSLENPVPPHLMNRLVGDCLGGFGRGYLWWIFKS
jgi:hypothetical protein